MLIIPALYIQKGHAISLYKGHENEQKKIYKRSALNLAREFEKKGAKLIQVIDLDGSYEGHPVNTGLLEKFVRELKTPLEVGGGVRTMEDIDRLMNIGVFRVILGVTARDLLPSALEKYGPERIVFGIKARQDMMVDSDSLRDNSDEVIEVGQSVVAMGVKHIVYKDLEREGTLYHPNYDDIDRLIEGLGPSVSIYSSGGIVMLDDLRILETIKAKGVVASRGFIEHKISLKAAIDQYQTTQDEATVLDFFSGTR
ncbi:hypothetical protein HN748_02095 [Candidatus Peregrinibacteria bacterium]|jgi:phosphoribosylformimino-5-aminoimidazole carboxamide ribotide isomerase|nr:hypothetical protein [Candidatus Peregrinibacteria bacterium]MBT7484263.1 hypothetical protein [Candidatus Peregrinibacteria bacterium]MBT7703000.1 hypothetical protein [Candidatus Peregrinibacteria bacterium]